MNANTNLNVLGGILDAMLANLTEMIDKRVEAKVEELTQRIVALETNQFREAAISVIKPKEDVIDRIVALEKAVENHKMASALNHTVTHSLIDEVEKLDALKGAAVLDLDSEEFRLAVIKIIDQQVMEDTFLDPLVEAVTDSDKFNDKINEVAKEAADSAADEALDNHTSDYDHDDIHEMSDHEMDSDAIREVVEEILNNSTVTFKI